MASSPAIQPIIGRIIISAAICGRALAMEGDGYIPAAKVAAIAEAVNNACDALDGVKDGVLNDPRRCHFDPVHSGSAKAPTAPLV